MPTLCPVNMRKDEKLKVTRTPDTSINFDDDTAILYDRFHAKTTKKRTKKDFKHTKKILLIGVSLILSMFITMLIKMGSTGKEVRNTNCDDKRSIKKVSRNVALINEGCTIDYNDTSKPYKYGLFNLKSGEDPHVILSEDLRCFSFKGCAGKVSLNFQDEVVLTGVGLFFPRSGNLSAKIREFRINGEIFQFEKGEIFQRWEFANEIRGKRIEIEVFSNHGNRKYTSIYFLNVYGRKESDSE